MTMPNDRAWSCYASWAVYAVCGRLGEADDVMGRYGPKVRACADWMRAHHPVSCKTIYRGIMIEDDKLADGQLVCDPRRTFASFSEDTEVARYFAHPKSIMNTFLVESNPAARGYVVEWTLSYPSLLFHHSWKVVAGGLDLARVAMVHPHIPYDQFVWNLKTQKEVIVDAHPPLGVRCHTLYGGRHIEHLNAWLVPPGILEAM